MFTEAAGCANEAAVDITSCLRKQPEETIIAAQNLVFDTYNPSLRWAFQPVIDGDLLLQRPIDQWATGKRHKVPIMTGHCTNEGTYYVPSNLSTSEEFVDFWHTLLPHF